jgi:hypothetical protein
MSNCHLVAGRSLIDLERCVNEMNWCHVGQQAWVNELNSIPKFDGMPPH